MSDDPYSPEPLGPPHRVSDNPYLLESEDAPRDDDPYDEAHRGATPTNEIQQRHETSRAHTD